MINLSTRKLVLKSSSQELFDFLGQTENMAKILTYKKVRHLKVESDLITFILKWVARFNFKITEKTSEHIQISSSKGVEFETIIRFEINSEKKGASVALHIETDTAPFVDFTLKQKIQQWITAIADNLETQFEVVEL